MLFKIILDYNLENVNKKVVRNLLLDSIKKLCVKKKINISTLEKMAGLSNGTIGKWDKASPQFESVVKVAEALNVKVDTLIRKKVQKQEGE